MRRIGLAGSVLLLSAACSGGTPQAVVTVTAPAASQTGAAAPGVSESPSFATPGTASDEEFVGPNCKQASKDAMKVSRTNNRGTTNPVLIAVIRIKGPVVDKTDNPPRNGEFYVCTGTGVFNSDSNTRLRFGYERQGGKYFTFYKPA